MFDENSNSAATLVGPAGTNTALHTANLNSTHLFNQLLNVKDSRWLQLEVCREFQRGQCSRSDVDCKFAHPPAHVDVQNGRVTACYDSIKGRCTRENPKCKYLHPPQHLKDQLLINGRNNLAIKNLISSQLIQPTAIPNNLQMAQLMQQQTQPMQTLPYQYYSTPLTAIYPLIPTANPADFQTLSPVAQQLALLQSQQMQQKQQVAAAISPLNNTSALAAHQYQQQIAQALLQQHLANSQQNQVVPSLQSQLYASGGGSPALTNQALTQQAINQQALTQQLQIQQFAASQQQQAALLAALTAQQQAVQQAQSQSQASSVNPLESRKRNARVAGFEENGSGEEKRSNSLVQSSSTTSLSTTTASQNAAEIAFQQQLLLLNSINANSANTANATASNGMPNGKRLDKNGLSNGHAIPIYAQQPTAGPQFGPYIYAPVSYSGQIPPRF